MSDAETEALAAKLHAIWYEAFGYKATDINFEREQPEFRECWIQVAQFVVARVVDTGLNGLHSLRGNERQAKYPHALSNKFYADEPDHR